MKELFLGIDAGTTTVKAVAFDTEGNELVVAQDLPRPHFWDNHRNVTQDMNLHWEIMKGVIRKAVEESKQYGEIKAVGVTAQGDGIWILDKEGKPLDEAPLWIDGRAASYIKKWEKEGVIGRSGRVAFNGSMLGFAAWLYDNEPEKMKRADKAIFCKDWVKYCLTGNAVTDVTDLSDASLVEINNPQYNREHLAAFGVEQFLDILPPIAGSTEIMGEVTKKAAEETGLPAGIPVLNGMIDICATAIGNGVVENNMACSIVGTTLFNEIVTNDLASKEDEKYKTVSAICGSKENQWLFTLGTMAGAPNLDWFLREFFTVDGTRTSFKELDRLVASVEPGSDGVIYHPYIGLGGERAPFVKPSACAQFTGLKNVHTKAHMLRAVYEGIALSMKDCYSHFPVKPDVIRLAGGGSNSEQWVQMFADNACIPIETTCGTEIGARGVAMMAAVASGYFNNLQEGVEAMVKIKKKFEPNPVNAEIYQKNYELYKATYQAMWDTWDLHHDIWNI